jgi:hypothetical protein
MITGIGTPRSQSRIPFPIVASSCVDHARRTGTAGVEFRRAVGDSDIWAAELLRRWRFPAANVLLEPACGRADRTFVDLGVDVSCLAAERETPLLPGVSDGRGPLAAHRLPVARRLNLRDEILRAHQ